MLWTFIHSASLRPQFARHLLGNVQRCFATAVTCLSWPLPGGASSKCSASCAIAKSCLSIRSVAVFHWLLHRPLTVIHYPLPTSVSVVVVTTSADLISELCPILEQFLSLPFSHWLFSFVSFGWNKKLRYSITHHALDYLNIFPFLPLPGLFRLNCLIPCVAPKQIWNLNNPNKSHPLLWHLGVLQDV